SDGDEHFADQSAFRASLFGDQHISEHCAGIFKYLAGGVTKFDAAAKAVLERAFAAPARMNLGFDNEPRCALLHEALGHLFCPFWRIADLAGWYRDAAFR